MYFMKRFLVSGIFLDGLLKAEKSGFL